MIGENTQKSCKGLKLLVVIQTKVKYNQLTRCEKIVRREIIIIIIIIIVDFIVPGDHRIKLKECKKKDKYLDLA